MKKLFALAVTFGSFISLRPLSAQDLNAMLQEQIRLGQMQAAQMQQMENGMIQQNMQNPQVQAMYQQHIASGGQMSFQQFAYGYAATGGYTQEGRNIWNQNEKNIQQRDQASLNAYRQNQDANNQAMAEMHQRNAEIAHQRGNLLNGTTDYVDPNTGNQYNLSHTAQPGTYSYDQGSGDSFHNDSQGNYYRQDSDGYEHELEEVE